MKVLRQIKMNVEHFEVGDQIKIKVKGIGNYTATVHKVTGDRALVVFDHCVAYRPMNENESNEGGFAKSDLCKWLNEEFIKLLPNKIRNRIVADEKHGGVLVRVPTRGEMFGQDESSEYYEPDNDERLLLMADRKNRICMSPDDDYAWYWLMNTRRESAATFAFVHNDGYASCNNASSAYGVRPAFEIRCFEHNEVDNTFIEADNEKETRR